MTEHPLAVLAATLVAYLLGSIPFGLLVGKARGVDVRAIGSGNIGATNVGRALGAGWAVVVLALDACKAFLPVAVAGWVVIGRSGELAVGLSMVAAVFGHVFPVYLRFRGGKGVASGLGAVLAVDALSGVVGAVVHAAVGAISRVSAIGSLSGVLVATAMIALRSPSWSHRFAVLSIALLIVARHRQNLRTMLRNRGEGADR